ncbi:GNAT family N-acetyltransferase [Arthrobacter agilis]|uniref:GNAT family N-acetyltransferase n=1 Tax=Arthrobacter agilis TaxID=37921 RepID=UPI000B34C633|nr:GNAT family N-acetyltransferase [Arthrobacter agilis]OUM45693.1 GNAT family N-acetyltransferase [Arthrobacter agilis]PPB47811.1 N-acetyltransferase [Arthrobacter agilis]TPV21415.1 GNAT family N-acetyltransferase [Arthrobacter agilis]VDR32229.1 putative acetyltransferase [Arthrobacter agilis]
MTTIGVVKAEDLPLSEVLALYGAVEWLAYTKDPDNLQRALEGSSTLVAAHDGKTLVGLARVVSDGASICYLQDILVRPTHHRRGIGRALAERALEQYPHVRQKVLITDDEPQQKAFYEALGYTQTEEFQGGSVRAFVRFD